MAYYQAYNYRESRPFVDRHFPEAPVEYRGFWGSELTGEHAVVRVVPRQGESRTALVRDEVRNSWPSR